MSVTVHWQGGAIQEFEDEMEAQTTILKIFRTAVYSDWAEGTRRAWESKHAAQRGDAPVARIIREPT